MDRLEAWVEEGAVETLITAGIDLQGRLYGKRFEASVFLRDMTDGVHTCDCNFGWDIERILIDGLEFTGWHKGYGDMLTKPDFTTLRMYPWFEKTALVICDTLDHDGNAIPIAPRTLLRTQVEKAQALGYTVNAAPEVEFFLFNESLDSSREKGYVDLNVVSRYISDYSIFRGSMDEWIIGEIRKNLGKAGVEVECSKAEWGHGQCEVNLVYTHALEMADRHAIFKNAVREICALNNVQATFMAKWHTDHSSSGCHVHMSLWEGDKPVFFDAKGEHHMSETARHFLGGMMHLAKDLQLFYAPNVNSYKRYEDLSFAPTTLSWGGDNRTTTFRIAGHTPASFRLENRIPGADAPAHLTYAAMIASGLYGLENKIEPEGPFIENNAYENKDLPRLNRNLGEAIASFTNSRIAREIFGDDVVNHYAAIAEWELKEFEKQTTDWERNRYFELI